MSDQLGPDVWYMPADFVGERGDRRRAAGRRFRQMLSSAVRRRGDNYSHGACHRRFNVPSARDRGPERRFGRGGPSKLAAILPVALAISVALFAWQRSTASSEASTSALRSVAPPPTAPAHTRSPVFGINMSLYTTSDELLTSASTQALLRSWGVPLIRVPLRAAMSDADLTRAMQAVLAVGATPMLILRGPKTGSVAVNLHLLSLITNTFGNRRVYLEYGNEADLDGVDADAYTAGWNQVIPALRQAAPAEYKFVGPANFQYNPTYAATFARNARPEPDYLSWHEYVCNAGNSDSYCTSHIANWATHADAVQNEVRAAVGHPIPFFISEWNLDPNDTQRYGNGAFIQGWTRSAISQLNELTSVGLAGAMIYTATDHGNFGIIDSGRVTPQGVAFRDLVTASSPGGTQPARPTGAVAPTPDAGPTPSTKSGPGGGASDAGPTQPPDRPTSPAEPTQPPAPVSSSAPGGGGTTPVHIGFEGGMDGWDEYWGYNTLDLSRTSTVHYDGTQALMMRTSGTGYVAAGTSTRVAGLHPGSRITFRVYTNGTGSGAVMPFVMDSSYKVHLPTNEMRLPDSARWFTINFTVPTGVDVLAIGLQLEAEQTNMWIALDGLTWPA